jgi:DHA2 family multidrug resistance protein
MLPRRGVLRHVRDPHADRAGAAFEPATFRDRNFAIGIVVALIMGMLQYTPMVLFPPLTAGAAGLSRDDDRLPSSPRAGLGNLLSFCIVAPAHPLRRPTCLFIGLSTQAVRRLDDGRARHAGSRPQA